MIGIFRLQCGTGLTTRTTNLTWEQAEVAFIVGDDHFTAGHLSREAFFVYPAPRGNGMYPSAPG